jgi:hypothetical protein
MRQGFDPRTMTIFAENRGESGRIAMRRRFDPRTIPIFAENPGKVQCDSAHRYGAVALAFLSVIPEGNLLLRLLFILSIPKEERLQSEPCSKGTASAGPKCTR